jgi:hypothetical protein
MKTSERLYFLEQEPAKKWHGPQQTQHTSPDVKLHTVCAQVIENEGFKAR